MGEGKSDKAVPVDSLPYYSSESGTESRYSAATNPPHPGQLQQAARVVRTAVEEAAAAINSAKDTVIHSASFCVLQLLELAGDACVRNWSGAQQRWSVPGAGGGERGGAGGADGGDWATGTGCRYR